MPGTDNRIIVAAKRIPRISDLEVNKDNDITSFSGMLFDIWMEIARANNFSYNVILGTNEIVGSPINGSNIWSGMIGMLLTKKADIIVAPVSVTAQRAAAVEFTIPIYEDATCIVTTATSNKGANRFLKLFQPFDYRVWLCIAATLITYSIILYFIHHFIAKKDSNFFKPKDENENNDESKKHYSSFGMYLIYMFGKMLTEDLDMQHLIYMKSERILMFFWWIFGIVINSLYTSVLVSLLIITKYEPVINSVEDLAALKSYSLCLQAGGYQIEYFNKASNPLYKNIYNYIQNHQSSMKYINVAETIFNEAYRGNCFGFVDHMVGSVLLARAKAQNVTCVDYWAPASIAFAYRKNWIYAKNITETLTKLHENGVISLIIRNYLSPLTTKTTQVNDRTALTVENFFSIFVLYAGAIGFAILVQIIEIIIKKRIIPKFILFLKNFRNVDHRIKS